MGKDS